MQFEPPRPVSVAYPDVYYTAPLISGLQQRHDVQLHALPADQSDGSALAQHGCVLVPPSFLLRAPETRLLPGIGISAHGATGTERLISPKPLESITEVQVHPHAGHLWPVLELLFLARDLTPPARVASVSGESTSLLCSGDLGRTMADQPGHDLGLLWRETTTLPLVLGVWACAPGAPYRTLRTVLGAAVREHSGGADEDEGLLHTTLLSQESDSLRSLYALAVTHDRAEANPGAIVFC